MYSKEVEDKYQEMKKVITAGSVIAFNGLINYGKFIQNEALCHRALVITFVITGATLIIWYAEIVDFGRASKEGRVI